MWVFPIHSAGKKNTDCMGRVTRLVLPTLLFHLHIFPLPVVWDHAMGTWPPFHYTICMHVRVWRGLFGLCFGFWLVSRGAEQSSVTWKLPNLRSGPEIRWCNLVIIKVTWCISFCLRKIGTWLISFGGYQILSTGHFQTFLYSSCIQAMWIQKQVLWVPLPCKF